MRGGAGKALEVGQGIERNIDLARRAAEFVTADFFKKLVRELAFFNKTNESIARIDARGNQVGMDLVAVLKHHTLRAVVLDDDPRNRRFRANLRAKRAGSIANGIGHGSGTAASKAPRAECAVNLSHVLLHHTLPCSPRAHPHKLS